MKSIRKIELKYSRVSLVKESKEEYSQTVQSSQDTSKVIRTIIGSEVTEVMIILHLNLHNKIIGYSEVARGGIEACAVKPYDVFRPAIIQGASRIILAHNHPSGNLHPSKEDLQFTKRIKQSGDILGIDVLDHIIVGFEEMDSSSYYSFLDQGLMINGVLEQL